MRNIITVTFLINGEFHNDTFADWIMSRAARLNLSGWVKADKRQCIEIYASGDPILIDAMEVACSLGPIDAQVHSIYTRSERTPKAHYRQPAQFIRY